MARPKPLAVLSALLALAPSPAVSPRSPVPAPAAHQQPGALGAEGGGRRSLRGRDGARVLLEELVQGLEASRVAFLLELDPNAKVLGPGSHRGETHGARSDPRLPSLVPFERLSALSASGRPADAGVARRRTAPGCGAAPAYRARLVHTGTGS